MAPVTTYFNTGNVIAGAAILMQRSRDVALTQVSAITIPAPTATTFTIVTADYNKLNRGDLLCLATVTNTFLAAEASTLAMITSMVASTAGYNVTVSPAMGTPPTTANGVTRVWTNRGATQGGIEWQVNPQVNLLYADQSLVPVSAVDKEKVITIKAPMMEASLANFALAAGIKDPTTSTVLQYNATDASRTDGLLLIQKAPNSLNRWTVVHKVKIQGAAIHKSDKTNNPVYLLEAVVLQDTTYSPDTFDALDA